MCIKKSYSYVIKDRQYKRISGYYKKAKKINTDNYASNDLLNLLSETLKDIQKQDNTIKLKINSFASINKDRF